MKVYGIPTCGSVKNAHKFLKNLAIDFDIIDLKKILLTEEDIRRWVNKVPLTTLFNTKGTKFKQLSLPKTLSDEEKIAWLVKEPLLCKRPIIECDNNDILVGFNESLYSDYFSKDN